MVNKDIIFIGGLDWFSKHKLPAHHIVEHFAHTNRVFYIDNFGGVRDLTLQHIPRTIRKLQVAITSSFGAKADAKNSTNIYVHQPLIIPTSRLSLIFGHINSLLLYRSFQQLITKHRISSPIIWTRVPTEVVWRSIQKLDYKLLLYQSVDHFPYSPVIPTSLRPRLSYYEKLFCVNADIIFASARGLYEEKQKLNSNTYFFPNGVNCDRFRQSNSRIPYMENLAQPIIGFIGALGPWVDYELIQNTAKQTPDWSYILIGSVEPGVNIEALRKLANVHIIGAVDHRELPSWLQYFNIGLIPYKYSEFTHYTFPSKMAEYFAADIPVLSTSLPEIKHYAEIVRLADSPQEMIATIQEELKEQSQKKSALRSEFANSLSWSTITSNMERIIDETYARKSF